MVNDLLASIAASTIFYELEKETNLGLRSLNIETFESCIKFYDLLCNGSKNAIDRAIFAINVGEDYFYGDDAATFIEKYVSGE